MNFDAGFVDYYRGKDKTCLVRFIRDLGNMEMEAEENPAN